MSAYPAAVAAGWFPVAAAGELGRRPLARMLMDTPLAVFRGEDGPAVLLDSCPHRNVPLSGGRVHGGLIECPYHGWRFGGDGRCALTPGAAMPAALRAKALAVVERAGLVWTTLAASAFPALPPQLDDAACDGFWWRIAPARARLADAVENLLDPAHPHFLHPGIVRSAKIRRPVQVTLRTAPGMAEAIYVENARAEALMPRLLEGMRTTGIGRFMPPATAQLIFEGPDYVRFALTVFFTPETATTVRSFAHFSTPRRRAPAFIKRALLLALHFPVLQQDRAMLRRQVEATERRGRMNYGLGPLDFLRPAIEALMAGEALDVSMTEAVIAL